MAIRLRFVTPCVWEFMITPMTATAIVPRRTIATTSIFILFNLPPPRNFL